MKTILVVSSLLLAGACGGRSVMVADSGPSASPDSGAIPTGSDQADAGAGSADCGPGAAASAWARAYHGDLEIDAVGADGLGAVYSGGYFVGTADFGDGHLLTSVDDAAGASTKDLFVAKHLASGRLAWVRHFGGPGLEGNVYDLVTSQNGTTYLSGAFSGTVHLDGTTLTSTAEAGSGSASSGTYGNMVLAAIAPDGNARWALQAGGDAVSGGNEVALGPDGSIAQVGIFGGRKEAGGSLAFGAAQPVPFDGGWFDTYVARFTADGALLWVAHIGGAGAQRGKGIVVDASGNVLVVGDAWAGETRFGAGRAFSVAGDSSTQDFWVAKYDPQGTLLWFRHFGSAGRDEVKGVGASPEGGLVVAAAFDGPSIAVLDRTLAGAAPDRAATGLVFGLAPDGQSVRFTNTIESVFKCCEIEVDDRGHVYAGLGAVAPTVRFGDGATAFVGGQPQGGLLIEFDPLGAAARTWTFDTDKGAFGELALLPNRRVSVSAVYEGRLVWGDTHLEGPSPAQALVVTQAP